MRLHKVIKPNCRLILSLLVALASSQSVFGQLIIDQSGARDVLLLSDQKLFGNENRVGFSFDSKKKSAGLGYFMHPSDDFLDGHLLWISGLKISAIDGYEQFFRFQRLPGIELSTMLNWTPNAPNPAGIPFVALQASYVHEEYEMFDPAKPAEDQLSKPSLDGAAANLKGGFLFGPAFLGGQAGVGVSVGYERSSNYKDLPQVQVSQSSQVIPLTNGTFRIASSSTTAARKGELKEFNGFPIQATLTYEVQIPTNWVSSIPLVPKGKDYYTIVAPYGRLEPTDGTKPIHGVGIQFSLKTVSGKDIKKMKLAYPISFFVEWANNSVDSDSKWQAGAATVWTF